MEELIMHIAKSLVDEPDQVQVEIVETDQLVSINLKVAESDMGKVIGRQGRVAQAIRGVLKAAGRKERKEVELNIG